MLEINILYLNICQNKTIVIVIQVSQLPDDNYAVNPIWSGGGHICPPSRFFALLT